MSTTHIMEQAPAGTGQWDNLRESTGNVQVTGTVIERVKRTSKAGKVFVGIAMDCGLEVLYGRAHDVHNLPETGQRVRVSVSGWLFPERERAPIAVAVID